MAKISIEMDGQERVVVLTPGNTVPVSMGLPVGPPNERVSKSGVVEPKKPPTLAHLDLDYLR